MSDLLASHQHVLAYLVQGVRTCLMLVLLVAVFAPLEYLFSVRKAGLFSKGWLANLGWYFVNAFAAAVLLGPPTALIAWATHAALPEAVTGAAAALPLWARMIAAMVVGELGFYWGHRWSHEWPWLWRFHAVHHSATHLNFLVNTRAHPIDMVFTRICGVALLYATGLSSPVGPHPTLIPALILFIGSLWSFFIHANLRVRLGPIEEVIATPAFHHWHHTYEDHKDKNFSAMVPVFDRIFGTFYLPKHWPAEYGTSTHMPDDILGQLIEPFGPPRKTAPATEVDTSRAA